MCRSIGHDDYFYSPCVLLYSRVLYNIKIVALHLHTPQVRRIPIVKARGFTATFSRGSRKDTTMKAIVYTQHESPDVLQFKKVEKPTLREAEVLIKVHSASLNAADWHYLRGTPFLFRLDTGLPKPQNPFLGADLAGRVETVGRKVTQFPGALGSTSVHQYGSRQKIMGYEYRNG